MNLKSVMRTLLVLGIFVFVVAAPSAADIVEDWTLAAENSYLLLYINEATTEVAVRDKTTETMWYSNPPHREQEETIARGGARSRLDSQLWLTYYTPPPDESPRRRDSKAHSIDLNQYEIVQFEEGVRVIYTLGQKWRSRDFLPEFISQEGLDELLQEMPERDRGMFTDAYYPFKLVEMSERKARIDIPVIDKDKVFEGYTMRPLTDEYLELLHRWETLHDELEELTDDGEAKQKLEGQIESLWNDMRREKEEVIMDFIRMIRDERRDIEYMEDITHQDVEAFIDTTTYMFTDTPPFIVDDMIASVQNLGYSPQNVIEEHTKYRIDPPAPNIDILTVPVDFRLDGKDLVVSIPTEEIYYPKNVIDENGRTVSYPLHSIDFLPFFGAAGRDSEGYIIVPDGSGALIHLNSERVGVEPYASPIYGRDKSFRQVEEQRFVRKNSPLPVFGLKQNDKGFLGIIEEGEALATIRADIAGRTNSYNNVYAQFITIPREWTGLGELAARTGVGSGSRINVYQSDIYPGELRIRYSFFEGERANYVNMANHYQDYLKESYNLSPYNREEELPFILELTGAIPKLQPVLGVAREVMEPLTTFPQVEMITAKLKEAGVDNINIRYRGWLAGGLRHFYPERVVPERALGGEDEFRRMLETLSDQGVNLYPDVSFLNVYQSSFWDSFNARQDAARQLDRTIARYHSYNKATNRINRDDYSHILSPARLQGLTEEFMKSYRDFGTEGISLAHFGTQVNSDFRRNEDLVDRQQAVDILRSSLEGFQNEGLKILTAGGNAPTIPYSKMLVNLPTESTDYNILNQSIPFYQIAVRGLLDYAGEPINMAPDPKKAMLKAVETGSSVYYSWIYASSSVTKGTDFDYLHANHYHDWLEDALAFYEDANAVLKGVSGQRISAHSQLKPNVFKTTFEDQSSVIVNYSSEEVAVNGLTVPAEDFVFMPGGDGQ